MLSYRSVALLAISLVVASIPPAFGEVAIGGRITLADEGFEGARVVLLPLDGRYQAGRALMDGEAGAEPVDETRTDGDGRFRLEAPEPGGWTVRVEAPDHLPAEAILRPLVEANELPTLELEAAQAMVVRIAGRGGEDRDDEDRDDGDVTRIAVEPPAQRQWQRSLGGWATPVRLAQTDADGVARLPVAAGEKVVLWADVPGSPRLRREVRAGKGVTLKPLGGIEHRVRVTVGRRGVAKALIFGKRGIIPLALTDSEGRATLTAPTDSALTLLALGPEGHRGSHSLEPPREDEPAREETIELAEPDWLSGQVVEHETRRPIPGAWMWQHRVDSDLVRTDARGGFRVPVPETATNFGAIALGYAAGGAAWQRSESSDLTLVLHPSASLSGVVVDSAGRPVGAAEAWLVVHRTAETRRSLRWFQRWLSRGEGPVTRSTRDGRFRLAGLPAGASYHLTWVKAGFVPTPVKIEPLEAFEHRDRLRMVLQQGLPGVGRVVDSSDAPVPGATVKIVRRAKPGDESYSGHLGGSEATSDAEGRFEFQALSPGTHDLRVVATGFAPIQVPGIEVAESASLADLGTVVLEPGVEISGTVVDPRRQPLAEAEIFVGEAGGQRGAFARLYRTEVDAPKAITDATGRFSIGDLIPGNKMHLMASKSGYITESLAGVTAPLASLEVVLTRASRVSGKVVDGTGEVIAGAQVSVSGEGGRFGPGSHGVTGPEGRFELEAAPPGRLTLSAMATGFLPFNDVGFEVAEGEDLEGLRLVLERGAAIEGRVADAVGEPVPQVYVSAQPVGGDGAQVAGDMTRDEGRYRIDGVAPGLYTVVAEHWRQGRSSARELEVQPGTNRLDLEFAGGVEVSGLVTDTAGSPVAGAHLSLSNTSPRWRGEPQTSSGEDGRFVFEDVPEGTYELSAGKSGFANRRNSEPIRVAGSPVTGLLVELAVGATVAGRILGVELDQLTQLQVAARRQRGGFQQGQIDYEGRYSIPHLSPGEWRVFAVLDSTGQRAEENVTVEDDSTEIPLDLELGTGLILSGVVLQEDTPVGGVSITLRQASTAVGETSTDYLGRFRLQGLEAGTYRLRAQDYRSGLRHNEEIELESDREITIEVGSGRITGSLRHRLDQSPIVGGNLNLEPVHSDDPARAHRAWATSDSQGNFRFDQVPEGTWRLIARKAGYGQEETTVDVASGAANEGLVIEMDATEGVTFEVFLTSGQVPPRVSMAVFDGSGRSIARESAMPATDGGLVRLTNVPAGRWELSITAEDSATVDLPITAPGSLGRIELPPGGGLEVRVPDLVDDDTSATASLIGPHGRPYRTMRWGTQVVTQHRLRLGQVTARHLVPGVWQVTVTAEDGRSWAATATVTAGATEAVSLR